VAHRGGASLAGGDVVEGLSQLVAWGVDAAEFDVRRTADKALVVHHEAQWRGLRLDRVSYRELVRHGAPIRRLDEVLAAADGRLALDVELKEPGYEADVVSALLGHIEPERLIVTSFLDEAVRAVKAGGPAVRTGLIVGSRAALHAPQRLLADVFPFGRLRDCGADFLAPNVRLLATGLHRRAKRRGIPLLLWTVNDEEEVRRYLDDSSILGVVTDSRQALGNVHAAQANIWPLGVSAHSGGR
jgi:glycerophosphoryl diester phosphodiesterase